MESELSARAAGKLVAALLEKATPLARLKEKASVLRRLSNKRVDDFENVRLLAARQLGDSFKCLADFATRPGDAARLRFAKQLLDSNAERLGHCRQNIRAWNLSAPFPIADVGGGLVDLAREFAHRQTGGFAQPAQVGLRCHDASVRPEQKKSLHVCSILHIDVQCNHA